MPKKAYISVVRKAELTEHTALKWACPASLLGELCNIVYCRSAGTHAHCILYTAKGTLHTVHCTLYTAHCTLYTE